MAIFPQGYSSISARCRELLECTKPTTMRPSKGLEFKTVAIVGLQTVPDPRQTEDEESQLLYVAMTRATHRLVFAGCWESGAVDRVAEVLVPRLIHAGKC